MIPMLILYLLRKIRKAYKKNKARLYLRRHVSEHILIITFLSITSNSAYGNDENTLSSMNYQIHRNNEIIGDINISRKVDEDLITYDLKSSIKTKFVLKFDITGKERSVYQKGKLIYSSIYREVNNKVKSNHKVLFSNSKYEIKEKNRTKLLQYGAIECNLVKLYFKEPKEINTVFCDNEKRMIPIKKLGNGKYRVEFSKSKYNIFHYRNGRCIKVEVHSKLFDVVLIPV